jgi:hypothetical protein
MNNIEEKKNSVFYFSVFIVKNYFEIVHSKIKKQNLLIDLLSAVIFKNKTQSTNMVAVGHKPGHLKAVTSLKSMALLNFFQFLFFMSVNYLTIGWDVEFFVESDLVEPSQLQKTTQGI